MNTECSMNAERDALLAALTVLVCAAETLLGTEENAPSYQDDLHALDEACTQASDALAAIAKTE